MQSLTPLIDSVGTLAEVRAHDQVMRYRRAGAGRPIVMLRSAGAEPFWPELDADLVSRFRVITPELPADCDDVAAWVAAFLEGVGLDRVLLVAADSCCLPALELVLLDGCQVEGLVLVPAGAVGETGLDGTLAGTFASASVPLLVVRRGLSAADALPMLRQFLSHGRQPTAVG
jgi:pimeloyl-ACP methyl ester carboxylesterase